MSRKASPTRFISRLQCNRFCCLFGYLYKRNSSFYTLNLLRVALCDVLNRHPEGFSVVCKYCIYLFDRCLNSGQIALLNY